MSGRLQLLSVVVIYDEVELVAQILDVRVFVNQEFVLLLIGHQLLGLLLQVRFSVMMKSI